MKNEVAVILASFLLASCETPPVAITPQPDVAAVRKQNVQTIKHISRTRQHIEASQKEEAGVDTHIQSAKKDLDDLLKE